MFRKFLRRFTAREPSRPTSSQWVEYEEIPDDWSVIYDIPDESPGEPLPSAGPRAKVMLDVDAELEGRAKVEISPRTIYKLMHEFPAAFRGEYRSRALIYTIMSHLCATLVPTKTSNEVTYRSSLKKCIEFSGPISHLPDSKSHHYHDAYEWHHEGELFVWNLHVDARSTRVPGTPLERVLSPKAAPYIKLFGMSMHRDSASRGLVISGPHL